MARTKAEDGRVSVRNLRRTAKQALEKLEKDGEVGEDDVTGAEKRLDGAPRSTPTRSTTCSSTRKPSCSRSERRPLEDGNDKTKTRPRTARPKDHGRAGRDLKSRRRLRHRAARRGRGLALLLEAAFMFIVAAAVLRRDLGAFPQGAARQGHRPARAADDARRRRDGRGRLRLRRAGAGLGDRGGRARHPCCGCCGAGSTATSRTPPPRSSPSSTCPFLGSFVALMLAAEVGGQHQHHERSEERHVDQVNTAAEALLT